MAADEDSNALYLVVGGLLVVALIFGFVVYGRYNNPANIEPAAGTTYSSTTINQPAPERDMEDNTPSSPSNTNPAPYTPPATNP
jgi:hypothetical protein